VKGKGDEWANESRRAAGRDEGAQHLLSAGQQEEEQQEGAVAALGVEQPAGLLTRRAPQEEKTEKKSSKKSSHKTVELDEKLWSQTQISVASWADCDEDDFGGAAPGAASRCGQPVWPTARGFHRRARSPRSQRLHGTSRTKYSRRLL